MYYMEVTAALLGATSVSGIGAFLLKCTSSSSSSSSSSSPSSSGWTSWFSLPSSRTATRLGLLALLGVALSALLEFASRGSSRLVPTFSRRASAHKDAAVGWQKLGRLTRSRRIQLRDPSLTPGDYAAWYAHLAEQRAAVSAVVLVPSATYRAFSDPARVFAAIRRQRDMFKRYQDMFQGKLQVLDHYDDD